jgi:hypothetical protein
MLDRELDVIRDLDELDTGPVEHDTLVEVADVAMGDAPFDDDRTLAQRDAEVVQRVELQRERGLDLRATAADVEDRHRLIDLDLPVQR